MRYPGPESVAYSAGYHAGQAGYSRRVPPEHSGAASTLYWYQGYEDGKEIAAKRLQPAPLAVQTLPKA